jgi:hypothetical protein
VWYARPVRSERRSAASNAAVGAGIVVIRRNGKDLDMHFRLSVLAALIGALLLSACEVDEEGSDVVGGGDTSEQPGTAQGTCVENDGTVCREFLGAAFDEEAAEATCTADTQTFIWGGLCSDANVIGTCRLTTNGQGFAVLDYYYSTWDLASAAAACNADGGRWTAR